MAEILETKKIFTVSQVTSAIKSLLEDNFQAISIQGEISNFKQQSSGHLYFSLKDKDAQISCVLFKGNAYKLTKLPKDGDQIIATGELSVYPPRGNYQLVIRSLSFQGLGDLLVKFHELKEKLKAKGWFEEKHKKKLPKLPKTIGVVTSPTGAVIQDILHVLQKRFSGVNVLLNPVKVQGDGAKEEIAKAIVDFNRYNLVDVMIVGRGGGSLEDLWAFNEEIVAEAIFNSKIPIISAVGHETDYSLSDFVADVRAPTPSAAATLVIGEKVQMQQDLDYFHEEMVNILLNKRKHFVNQIGQIKKHPFLASPTPILSRKFQKLDDSISSLDLFQKHLLQKKIQTLDSFKKQLFSLTPSFRLKMLFQKTKNLSEQIDLALFSKLSLLKEKFQKQEFYRLIDISLENFLKIKNTQIKNIQAHLQSIDPKNLLKRGYSILFSEKQNSIILSTKQVSVDDSIKILVSDGKLQAKIKEIL